MSVVTMDAPAEVLAPEQEVSPERLRIRAELNRRRMLREAAAIHDVYVPTPQPSGDVVTYRDAAARRGRREELLAQRRDQLRRLAVPMEGAEVLGACQHAAIAAKVPTDDVWDVAQDLAVVVYGRHGAAPLSCDVSANWLRLWAQRIAQRQSERRERATGMRAAADQLTNWRDADNRAAAELAAANGGDPVWCIAAGTAASNLKRDRADAERLALQLRPLLTYLQTDAVRIAVSEVRAAMPGRVRVAFHAACKILRRRFLTADAVRCAVRPDTFAADLLASAAIHHERRRADVTSRGNGTAAGRWQGSLCGARACMIVAPDVRRTATTTVARMPADPDPREVAQLALERAAERYAAWLQLPNVIAHMPAEVSR